MKKISKLGSTRSVLENDYCSVENRCSVSTFRSYAVADEHKAIVQYIMVKYEWSDHKAA